MYILLKMFFLLKNLLFISKFFIFFQILKILFLNSSDHFDAKPGLISFKKFPVK